jgi:hypothetical protein
VRVEPSAELRAERFGLGRVGEVQR